MRASGRMVAFVTLAVSACGGGLNVRWYRARATDGTAYTAPAYDEQPADAKALVRSAARDIPCSESDVSIVSLRELYSDRQRVLVDGCGIRMTYQESCVVTAGARGVQWMECTFVPYARMQLDPGLGRVQPPAQSP